MTKIKMCGLSRECDIEYANILKPEYIGFVFAKKSNRYVTPEKAEKLIQSLDSNIIPVGVFVDEDIESVCELLKKQVIKIPQLHGHENNDYIDKLKKLTDVPVIQAFRIANTIDIEKANSSHADFVLLDSGAGSGKTFNHELVWGINRPYFLAGGLTPENVKNAVNTLNPYAVDASSCLETDGFKDFNKMQAFAEAVRKDKEYVRI